MFAGAVITSPVFDVNATTWVHPWDGGSSEPRLTTRGRDLAFLRGKFIREGSSVSSFDRKCRVFAAASDQGTCGE